MQILFELLMQLLRRLGYEKRGLVYIPVEKDR